jgi:hypothetical protein
LTIDIPFGGLLCAWFPTVGVVGGRSGRVTNDDRADAGSLRNKGIQVSSSIIELQCRSYCFWRTALSDLEGMIKLNFILLTLIVICIMFGIK